MSGINKQFDPAEQMAATCDELGQAMLTARAAIDRVEWLKDKMLAELAAARDERDRLEMFTEAEAAAMLRIENGRRLADLRRRLDLPHCKFGNDVCYTKQHLAEIAATFEIRKRPTIAGVIKKAA